MYSHYKLINTVLQEKVKDFALSFKVSDKFITMKK